MFKSIGRFLRKKGVLASILTIAVTLATGGTIKVIADDASQSNNSLIVQ